MSDPFNTSKGVSKGQLRNALGERDAWRRRCEEARAERNELRAKIKRVRKLLSEVRSKNEHERGYQPYIHIDDLTDALKNDA